MSEAHHSNLCHALGHADRRAAASRPSRLAQPLHGFGAIFFDPLSPPSGSLDSWNRAAQLAIRVTALHWLLALYNRRYLTERGAKDEIISALFPLSLTLCAQFCVFLLPWPASSPCNLYYQNINRNIPCLVLHAMEAEMNFGLMGHVT